MNKKLYAGATAITVVAVGGYLYYRHINRALQQEENAWKELVEDQKRANTWGQSVDMGGEGCGLELEDDATEAARKTQDKTNG